MILMVSFWVAIAICILIALNAEARKERKKWNLRYNTRRGNFEKIWK